MTEQEKKDVQGSLLNFEFAINNCGGIDSNGQPIKGSQILMLVTSKELLKNTIQNQSKEIERLNALLNPKNEEKPEPNP
jgi:hypothetical protein